MKGEIFQYAFALITCVLIIGAHHIMNKDQSLGLTKDGLILETAMFSSYSGTMVSFVYRCCLSTCLYSIVNLLNIQTFLVFHQADGAGRPGEMNKKFISLFYKMYTDIIYPPLLRLYLAMDLGHVISSLNKLDAADEEKIVLVSRDGKNVFVVSYADVALLLEKAYCELVSNSVPHPVVQ